MIDITGELTGASEEALAEAYARTGAEGGKVVILNFTGLDYMNSSGIGLLVTMLIRAQRHGQKLMAYGLSGHYRQISGSPASTRRSLSTTTKPPPWRPSDPGPNIGSPELRAAPSGTCQGDHRWCPWPAAPMMGT